MTDHTHAGEEVPTMSVKALCTAFEGAAATHPGQVGRLNGVSGTPGTVLGPDLTGQWYAIIANDERGCSVRYATAHDIAAARLREPHTVAEARGLRPHMPFKPERADRRGPKT